MYNSRSEHSELNMALLLLEKLNQIGIALSTEKDISILMEKILLASKEITNAEGGTIYLVSKDKRSLLFNIMINDVLHIHYGGSGDDLPPFPALEIYDEKGAVNNTMVAAYSAGYKKKVNIIDAYTVKGFNFQGTKAFDARMRYRSKSFLTVPMLDAKNELLGILQLINPHSSNGGLRHFTSFDEDMVESLTSQASVSFSNRLLLDETQKLFESMIDMINLALDEKSPYTNKHCQRVPIITMLLAEAVIHYQKDPFKQYNLNDEQKNELRIAALLHDCGKIVTPVHVIDKSKKLELLTDRFDVIEYRAETIKKELEIDYLKKTNQNAKAKKKWQEKSAEIDEDLEFLSKMNYGGEVMRDEDVQRVHKIAEKWCYHSEDGKKVYLVQPEELKHLTVRYGTLTSDEREIINYHVSASIKMLESLPWPEKLKNVPEYAGGHHERVDGKGYPKGLTGDQMSVPAKIMGIADIFEALTAVDRPYKKPKKLSESLLIMDQLADNGHIDPDLYQVFIQQKVYLEYADQYLNKEQIDVREHCYNR